MSGLVLAGESVKASNRPLERTAARVRSLPPLTGGVDMTSTVKYHGDAGIGRAAASLGLVPDFADAAVIDTTRDERCGGIPR